MKWENIWAIARKDWREVRRNNSAWVPMLVIPLIFVIAMPLFFLLGSQIPAISRDLYSDPDVAGFLANLPESMRTATEGMDHIQTMLVYFLGYFFAPFFLIMPLMFAAVIAAESFAGELERKTMEALLYTPASDSELFMGKVVAAFVPAVLITWISFLVAILVNNIAGWPIMGQIWFPLPTWYPMMFWVSPAISALAIAVTVLISARVKTFMGAYQTSSALVVIILGFIVGQATGVLYLSIGLGLVVGAVFWLIAIALMLVGIKKFNRKSILLTAS